MTATPQDPDVGESEQVRPRTETDGKAPIGAPSDPPAWPETGSNGTASTHMGQPQRMPMTQQLPPAQTFSSRPPATSSITGANLNPAGAADMSGAADVSGAADMSGAAPTVRGATPEWSGGASVPPWGTLPAQAAATGSVGYWPPPVAPTYPTQPTWPAQGPWQPLYPTPGWGPQPYPPGVPTAYQPAASGYGTGFAPALSLASGPQPGLEWGGVGVRFWALIVDVFLFIGVFMAWAIGSAALGIPTKEVDGVSPPGTLWFTWFLMILVLIYHPVCWYFWGGSPGQKALGLRVARSSDGQSLGVGAVLVRYLVFSVVTLLLPLGIISALVTANDPFKRAWHDTAARSVVVRRI